MALDIGQIAAASYPAVLNEKRKPTNQWSENALLAVMEKMGMIVRKSFGSTLEEVLDYKRNAATEFLQTDLAPVSLSKTEVLTAASYGIAEVSVPVTWSKKDEVQNPTENQKVALVRSLLENGIESHDDLLEESIFATSAIEGFLPANVLIPTNGQGTVGGIDASTELFWRSQAATYASNGTDIEAKFTALYNDCSKGSGSSLAPELMFSGADPHALFESTQQPLQRYEDQTFKVGAKVLIFKNARYIFSQYGGSKVYFVNRKAFGLRASKQYFRDKSETQELQGAHGFGFKIYSAVQLVTGNKSRLGVAEVG